MSFVEGEYYQPREVESFGEHLHVFRRAIENMNEKWSLMLDPSKSKTFVLGGIYPYNRTKDDFLEFADAIHPRESDVQDKHVILDINRQTLDVVKRHYSDPDSDL